MKLIELSALDKKLIWISPLQIVSVYSMQNITTVEIPGGHWHVRESPETVAALWEESMQATVTNHN